MDNEQFNIIQHKLDEINRNIVASHQQQYGWSQDLKQRQINIEKRFGISDDTLPFEPFYPQNTDLSPEYPDIFNKYGEPMEVFFIKDRIFANTPNSKDSRYIIWDRYNYGLKTHFYTQGYAPSDMFKIVGKPERVFGIIFEPRSIIPNFYQAILDNKDFFEKTYEAIFTYDAQLVSTLKNAVLTILPFPWYSTRNGCVISEYAYKYKNKNISMLCSFKEMCKMHILRKKLAFRLKKWGGVDTYGTFDGGEFCPQHLPYQFYRYSVAVENDLTPYYFTEKIMDCFVAQTIPIYCGASKIDEYFNPDGIIKISVDDFEHIEDILKNCTPEEYERRLPAVIENYWRVQKYLNFNNTDRIYLDYFKLKS